MAVILLSFIATSLFLESLTATEQNFRILNCKVTPAGENLESEFRLRASEKGVRIVYLNLKIGNNSYNPLDLPDEFLPDRWVWARSNNEPMLSLPFDFDILSLGLLNYQVGSMTVPLRDEPSGCLAGLNSTCQNLVVGRALLDNVTSKSGSTGVVCVAMIEIYSTYQDEKLRSIKYRCCSSNVSSIHCDLSIVGSRWLQAIKTFLYCLSAVVVFYCPALLLLLPDCIFNLQNECDKEDITENQLPNGGQARSDGSGMRNGYQRIQSEEENRLSCNTAEEIPVDDASPVICSTFLLGCVQLLPDLKSSFNVKLAVLMFCIFPFSFYFPLALFFFLKPKYIHERLKQPISESPEFSAISVGMISPSTILILTVLVLPCWTALLFLKPKDLYLNKCPLCDRENVDSVSIGNEILHHLKLFPETVYFFMLTYRHLLNRSLKKMVSLSTCNLEMNYRGSRMRRALFSLWLLFSSLFTLFLSLVGAAFCLFLLLVSVIFLFFCFSPLIFLLDIICKKVLTMTRRTSDSIVLRFTTMGLVLNAEIVIPYLSFLVVAVQLYVNSDCFNIHVNYDCFNAGHATQAIKGTNVSNTSCRNQMILKLKNQNMAAFKAVAFQSLACVWFCVSTAAAVQNCSLVNCKVLPVGENIASEFRLKASEKGVRMIYLNLKIGNNSYNPLELQDEFQPDRWVWARSNKEPMLSLPYDYDILSLGLLNYQVRSMKLPLRDEPSGCLAGLNSTCQDVAVGRALLDNVTSEGGKTGVVCVAAIEKTVRNAFLKHDDTISIKYHCCRFNASSINCDVPVEGSNWYQAIYNFLICLAVVLMFYFPALPLLLPDYIFNLQYECNREGNTDELTIHARSGYEAIPEIQVLDEIPVDDASPVTCSTALLGCVQQLPDVKLSFNLKLAVLLLCIFPFGFYVNVGIFLVLKEKYFDELFMKVPPETLARETPMFFSLSRLFYPTGPFQYFLVALSTLTCLMAVLFLRPTDLFLNQNFVCVQCHMAKHLFSLPITENEDSVSIGDKILHHLNIMQKVAYLLMFKFLNQYKTGLQKLGNISTCYLKVNHNGSRIRRAH
ncbi:unnamed protein product [Porites evermanni]|uniref:Uncharacterized protein n=1 Tax=Porites evermanni TaxID=104178 RepID=A0ABN8LTD7_9CNID|nr:unnamed protein product [Porites evermanni]